MTAPTVRPLVEGPLAIDLLNTRWQQGQTAVDWLESDEAIREIHRENGHEIGRDVDDLNDLNDLKERRASLVEARGIIEQLFTGGDHAADTARRANVLLADARVSLETDAGHVQRSVSAANPAKALAVEAILNAADLIETMPERMRRCDHTDCVLWFADTSRAGRRKWCSMATCGNRSKANRHYQRSLEAPDN